MYSGRNIYHKTKHKGYILHIAKPSASSLPDEFLDHVMKETKNSPTLKVFVYGSSIDRIDVDEGIKEAKEDRDYIVQLIKERLKNMKSSGVMWILLATSI